MEHINEQQLQPVINYYGKIIKDKDNLSTVIKQMRKEQFQGNMKYLQEYQQYIKADAVKQIGEFYLFVRNIDTITDFEEILEDE